MTVTTEHVLAELVVGTHYGAFNWEQNLSAHGDWILQIENFKFYLDSRSLEWNCYRTINEHSRGSILNVRCGFDALLDTLEKRIKQSEVDEFKQRCYDESPVDDYLKPKNSNEEIRIEALKCLRQYISDHISGSTT